MTQENLALLGRLVRDDPYWKLRVRVRGAGRFARLERLVGAGAVDRREVSGIHLAFGEDGLRLTDGQRLWEIARFIEERIHEVYRVGPALYNGLWVAGDGSFFATENAFLAYLRRVPGTSARYRDGWHLRPLPESSSLALVSWSHGAVRQEVRIPLTVARVFGVCSGWLVDFTKNQAAWRLLGLPGTYCPVRVQRQI